MRPLVRHASLLLVLASTLLASASTAAQAARQPLPPLPPPELRPNPVAIDPATDEPLSPVLLASTNPLPPVDSEPAAPPVSAFEAHQVVSFYGHPTVGVMGELGLHEAVDAAVRVKQLAAEYDALNGDRDALGALHLIVDVAQAKQTDDGLYLERMGKQRIAEYVEVAREFGILLFVDLQIGWSDPLEDTRRLEWFLREPFVHLALDPEFATKRSGYAPGRIIGALDADQVNAVQRYLAALVLDAGIPPKILVLHQFKAAMLIEPERFEDVPEVEITIDMDGFGGTDAKVSGFRHYAQADYAERSAFKLFYHWDLPVMSIQQVVDLNADYVIYQ